MKATGTIEDYIADFPKETQQRLQQVRATIRNAAPQATEAIKYGIPTFILYGNLVHFGGYKNHIGFYPAPSGTHHFAEELSAYKVGKGTIQFPMNAPLPLDLITKIVKFRANECLQNAVAKKMMRTCENGHTYYKSGDCKTCPECEAKTKLADGFLSMLSAPARRALTNNGINELKQLSSYTKEEILQLHGMGPASIPVLLKALQSEGLGFRER